MSDGLRNVVYGDKTVLELKHLWENGHINLEPGFQRKSVWTVRDRKKLIESILEEYPIPSIFLYTREENGEPVYDVIDGKQRLETIFMFTKSRKFKRQGFNVRFEFPGDEKSCNYDWNNLEKPNRASFLNYKIQTVEVKGNTSDIISLFVRINSTGKALTSAEKRNARFNNSAFLNESIRLAKKFNRFLTRQQIVRANAVSRMKDVELMSELLVSIYTGGPINKKAAVDRTVGNTQVAKRTLRKKTSEVTAVLNLVKRMFPDLRATRFRNIAEFYTLFMVVWEMGNQKLVLNDRRRNAIAEKLLRRLSDGVDQVREMQKKLTGKRAPRLYADYLLTVQQATDNLPQRKRRAEILRSIFGGIFARKDTQRIFSPEQKRILWNSEESKKCRECGKALDWTNFQVDHIKAYVKGGKTDLGNAALICASCNASKGARKKARSKKV